MRSQTVKTLIVMLPGKPVTIEEFENTLKGEVATHILPQYIWRLKKLGADIKAHKNGKAVTAYQLMNPDAVRHLVVDEKPAKKKPATVIRMPVQTKSQKVENVEINEDGEVSSVVDSDFDTYSVTDLV